MSKTKYVTRTIKTTKNTVKVYAKISGLNTEIEIIGNYNEKQLAKECEKMGYVFLELLNKETEESLLRVKEDDFILMAESNNLKD